MCVVTPCDTKDFVTDEFRKEGNRNLEKVEAGVRRFCTAVSAGQRGEAGLFLQPSVLTAYIDRVICNIFIFEGWEQGRASV